MRFSDIIKLREREHNLTGPDGIIARLKRISGEKQNSQEKALNYLDSLDLAQRIDNNLGAYSQVYYGKSGGNYVVKISDFSNWASSDNVLEVFLKLGKEKSNPLFPRIYGYQTSIEKGWFWVVMEKLNILEIKETKRRVEDYFGETIGYTQTNRGPQKLSFSSLAYNINQALEYENSLDNTQIKDLLKNNNRTPKQKENFINLVKFIQALRDAGFAYFDLEYQNMGFRENGELVLFDPIA